MNGQTSWISDSQAIWYIPKWKQWVIGSLDDIGTTSRGIRGHEFQESGLPYNNYYMWDYWDYEYGNWIPDFVRDIKVMCTGKV